MKKTKRILIITIVISYTVSISLISTLFLLSGYSKTVIDDSLLDTNRSYGETEFYYYDFDDRYERKGDAMLLSDAYLADGRKYEFVPYNEIGENLINAFIAIEDKRFFAHHGIDPMRSAHAVINYVLRGGSSFGGSSITQQLVKNLTGDADISIKRKLREAINAINLERKLDKSEILESYLNVINLSGGCYGVGAAARRLYSKRPCDLTLSECATIAAITNNPTKYDPIRFPENNRSRRDLVLECMYDQGYISLSDYQSAINEPISLNPDNTETQYHINSWYVDMVTEDVIRDMCEKYNIGRESASGMLYRGGYRIYTAIDPNIQSLIEEYYADVSNFPIDESGEIPQSSMIILDPYTCDILAVAGAVGEKKGNRIQNYATQTKRPPGSAIKPLSVYAPALENGIIEWSSIMSDTPIRNANGTSPAWPSNASEEYKGNVTVKYSIEHSLNTVAVRLLNKVGNNNSLDLLRNKLRIKNLDPQKDVGDAALALGQPSHGITLRELTSAYSIFYEGVMCKPRSYFKVTDSNGKIILDNTSEYTHVISRENAAIMTKLLQTVVESGTASGRVTLSSKTEVAGKTGTTQNNCDRYFIGYTPKLICGVWFGYEYPKPLEQFGGNFSITLWDDVVSKIYDEIYGNIFTKKFIIPDTVGKLSYNSQTGSAPSISDPSELIEDGWFILKD